MFSAGLILLVFACALLLSSLQGWALRGGRPVPRYVVAWLAGTALVSLVLVATWGVAVGARQLADGVAALSRIPVPRADVVLVLDVIVALGVAAALGAGAMHARMVRARMRRARHAGRHPRDVVRGAWVSRAAVQGATLCLVGGVGAATLLLASLARLR